MSESGNVPGFLERRAGELVEEVRALRMDSRAAVAFMRGAVRALEAVGSLDRDDGSRVLEGFVRRLEDEGLVETITWKAGVSETVEAEGARDVGPARPMLPRPDLGPVVAVGRDVDVPSPHRLVLLSLVCWTTQIDLDWAWFGPVEEDPSRSDERLLTWPVWLPWRIDAWDDAGTRFEQFGGGASGGDGLTRFTTRMKPAIPDVATSLTVALRSLDDHVEIARVILDLPGR